jgi:MFS family permease
MRDRLARFTVAMVIGVLAAVAVAAAEYPEVSAHSADRTSALRVAFAVVERMLWMFLAFGLVAGFLFPHPGPMSGGWSDRLRRFLAAGVGVGLVSGIVFGFLVVLRMMVVDHMDPMRAVRSGLLFGLTLWMFVGVGAGVALGLALRVVRPAARPAGPENPLLSERLRASLAAALAAGLTIGIADMLLDIASAPGVEIALKDGTENDIGHR